MSHESECSERDSLEAIFKPVEERKKRGGILRYIKLLIPVLLFPVLYFPYMLWWRRGFAEFSAHVLHGIDSQVIRLMLTGNNTILLFWCLVTAVVMLTSIVLAIIKVRPWYLVPLYIAVMFSLCGIFSLLFYTAILR